ncbi:MAG: hypothetical protein J5U17_07695 [Candidatus Methanoperedens sp.]|nr:hypothetical protein [Candidatus Methanoperedens sp.]MCE8425643.1 hypothetical protein [Candidatus Methanoperedens sp.]MCE8428472.1 hypothetical protein [Candidatus Methanoperedens sp.]
MKVTGKLIFKSEDASELIDIIARSLAPDNLSNNITVIGENTTSITFTSDKIGTILSSVDDYLMNAVIVEKLSYTLKDIKK